MILFIFSIGEEGEDEILEVHDHEAMGSTKKGDQEVLGVLVGPEQVELHGLVEAEANNLAEEGGQN